MIQAVTPGRLKPEIRKKPPVQPPDIRATHGVMRAARSFRVENRFLRLGIIGWTLRVQNQKLAVYVEKQMAKRTVIDGIMAKSLLLQLAKPPV